VAATSRGVFDYLTKPFDSQQLLEKVAHALTVVPAAEDEGANWSEQIVSRSNKMADLLAEARVVAASEAPVLIEGESGTGKELLASAIHAASPRAAGPFVVVNCGAIPEQLLESELFGHPNHDGARAEAGADGAHEGLLQQAAGGTLVLDEVGQMPLPVQAKLARALEDKEIRHIGATQGVPVDVRILSTSQESLDSARAAGRFRDDLYYRLNVVRLRLPTLAQRREDIPLLAGRFLSVLAARNHKNLKGYAPDALEALVTADWPGNVRQLYHVIEQVSALATTPLIPYTLVERALHTPSLQSLTYAQAKARFERDYLVQLLKLTDGNVSDAAKLADRNRTKFYSLLQRHGLTPSLFRNAAQGEGRGRTNGSRAQAARAAQAPHAAEIAEDDDSEE